ncbi:MAG: hypothetical protein JO335_06285 [Sphingomonas sp.]|nr:hypothetical protein [Sphingomonas sp.]
MRAVLRWWAILLAGGLWLVPAAALAQQTPPATTNTPATDAIGPSELKNFSLPGTKAPAEAPPATAPAATPAPRTQQPVASAPQPQPARRTPMERPVAQAPAPISAPPPQTQAPAAVQTSAPPPIATVTPMPPQVEAPTAASPAPINSTIAPERGISFLPWLIAALALAGAVLFFLWQRRPREVLADGSQIDLFVAPEPEQVPAPAPPPRAEPAHPPVPAPAPEPPQPKAPVGIVSSRLRPSLEIGVQPLRCVVDDSQVRIEFELDLFNAGSAPARAVLAEATLFNPGATQEQELSAFFSNPVGAGNRLDAIPPLKRITLTSQVVAPRTAIQEYELAGRKSFVPVIAFNALYEWSGGKGQTSAAYLVGRETSGDKLGPVRLDQGAREVTKLGARPLPTALRT